MEAKFVGELSHVGLVTRGDSSITDINMEISMLSDDVKGFPDILFGLIEFKVEVTVKEYVKDIAPTSPGGENNVGL